MGCIASKRVDDDLYHPPAASVAKFDISALEEPWLAVAPPQSNQNKDDKVIHVPTQLLNKLDSFELGTAEPQSWSELSKALEDLKPNLYQPQSEKEVDPPVNVNVVPKVKPPPQKSNSFHTVEELDSKMKVTVKNDLRNNMVQSKSFAFSRSESVNSGTNIDSVSFKPVFQNSFILRDRMERKSNNFEKRIAFRRDPLASFLEKCPPGGADSVILYTTSLRGVRRTFEDCKRAREILETHRVELDERDVSLHGNFLKEMRELIGEEASVPRLFVKGRYIGGVDELVELDESGRLSELFYAAKIGRGLGRRECEGCGGARFVPCLECKGSCKVFSEDDKTITRCPHCNENGLTHCPLCL